MAEEDAILAEIERFRSKPKPAPEPEPKGYPGKDFVDVGSQGLVDTVSLFGVQNTAINSALEKFGVVEDSPLIGSEEIEGVAKKVLGSIGIDTRDAKPGNWVENLVQIGASAAVPMGVLMKLGQMKDAPKWLKLIGDHPKTFLASEAFGIGTASAGRTVMEKSFPENQETAGMIGELLGIPFQLAFPTVQRTAKFSYKKGKEMIGKGDSPDEKFYDRAADVIQENVKDRDAAIRGLDEFGDSPVAPAKQSGDPGLIQATRDQAVLDPGLYKQNEIAVTERLTRDLENTLSGNVRSSAYVDAVKDRITKDVSEINESVEMAARNLTEELDQFPAPKRSEVSRMAREKLDETYGAMKAKEDLKWESLDLDAPTSDVSNTAEKLADIIQQGRNARDIPSDMVQLIRKHLYSKSALKTVDGKLTIVGTPKKTLTAKTLQNLRSRLLSEIEKSASGVSPDRNRTALLGELQESLLKDMGNITEVSGELANARAFSWALNNKFNRGPIGKLRGTSADGSLRTDPDLTFNKLVSTGEEGGVNIKALVSADSSPKIKNAASEYMSSLFMGDVMRKGQFNVNAAQRFLDNYSETLDHLPKLRDKIVSSIEKGNVSEITAKKGKVSLEQIKKTKTASLLNLDNPKKFIKNVRLSASPTHELKQAMDVVRGDPDAVDGLRSLVFEETVDSITGTKRIPGSDLPEFSRARAEKVLNPTYRDALVNSGLYTREQMDNVEYFLKQLNAHMRTAEGKVPGTSGTVQDGLGTAARMTYLKFVSPHINPSGGGSLSFAQTAGNKVDKFFSRLGVDKTNDLIKRALLGSEPQDKELLRILLERTVTPQEQAKFITRLNTYLLTTGQRHDRDDTPVEKEAYRLYQ